ncbi:hypothetical protein AAK899_05200, partial [Erysipelotrichaceae bacterium 51-3]
EKDLFAFRRQNTKNGFVKKAMNYSGYNLEPCPSNLVHIIWYSKHKGAISLVPIADQRIFDESDAVLSRSNSPATITNPSNNAKKTVCLHEQNCFALCS